MRVGHDNRVHAGRVDASRPQRGLQLTCGGAEQRVGTHSSIEQDDPVAEVHDQDVLLQHGIVGRQEVVGQFARDLRFVDFEERGIGVTKR